MAHLAQTAVLAEIPAHAAYLFFSLKNPQQLIACLQELGEFCIEHNALLGIGSALMQNPALKSALQHHRFKNQDIHYQNTDLLIWLRANDPGEIYWQSATVSELLADTFTLQHNQPAFCYQNGRDLSGYEDGTENPVDADAQAAAIIAQGPLAGSSFFVVQRWLHQLAAFKKQPQSVQDNTIGRCLSDNEELDDAPESAHVKRTAQESFTPEVFMLRRSMPWAADNNAGLMFTAFVTDVSKFERMLARMTGEEDGIQDALFSFSNIQSTSYFWCPALHNKALDFSPCGIIL